MSCRLALVALAALLAASLLPGALEAEEPKGPFVLEPDVRFWGADMTVGYKVKLLGEVETVLWAHLGGAWESHHLYRDFSASPTKGVPTSADDAGVSYDKLTFDWQLGVSQGILWSQVLHRNLLEAILLAKWRLDRHYEPSSGPSSLMASSALADRDGIFLTSFLLAVRLDGVATTKPRQTKNGVYAEASAEWAPPGLFGSPADYVRLNAHVSGLATLAEGAHVALLVGDRVEGDLLLSPTGDTATIPVWARTTLGGMNPFVLGGELGLGGAVRGVDDERFDGTLKLVNNLELRILFPEILPIAIFPGLVLFGDAGLVDQDLDRRPSFPRDLLVSAGAGLYLHAQVADFVLYGSWCFTPAEASGFMVSMSFGTQF